MVAKILRRILRYAESDQIKGVLLMEELLNEYRERFDENFPIMLFRGIPEDEVMQIIQKCLSDGKPFEADLDTEADY